ncbi:cytochrome b/b6 domain-containing protein [Aquabacterium sp.]|uniref:cytochrome b/b6 domain-containing protein n=1 Tax=Aquabacterium sp. TaxID=1872578 RepID=UPI003BF5B527
MDVSDLTRTEVIDALSAPRKRIRLWDLPLRLFHWGLLASVGTAIATGLAGGGWMSLHAQAGLAVMGLVVFRLVWGGLGSTYARFATFVPGPATVWAYVKGQWQGVGHNPLGALSVLALLGVVAAQALTGAFGNDEISFTGPLASLVSEERSIALTNLHHQLVKVLYGLIALHVAAIVFYTRFKKDNLVRPMVTGWKDVPASVKTPHQAGWGALTISLVVSAASLYVASGVWVTASNGSSSAADAEAHEGHAKPAEEDVPAVQATPAASGEQKAPAW